MYLLVIKNLIARTRIEEALNASGVSFETIIDRQIHDKLSLDVDRIIVDLTCFDCVVLNREVKGILSRKNVKLIGYYPHVQKILANRARDAGFNTLYTNEDFFKNLNRSLDL